jgi:hypothetical protein
LQVFFLIKDKKIDEALKVIPASGSKDADAYSVLLRAQLFLNSKRQKEAIMELITFVQDN